MTTPFNNPLTGGEGALVRSQIKSPNFNMQQLIGWAILKNGDAFFNDVTITGTFSGNDFIINSQGVFIYTGTPALGNLLVSIAGAAGVDTEGNVYPAGVKIYNGLLTLEAPAQINFPTGATIEQTPANQFAALNGSGAAAFLQALFSGPQTNVTPDWVQIQYNSSNAGATTSANGNLVYVDSTGGAHSMAFWDSLGFDAQGQIVAEQPGATIGVAEIWHTFTLINGFTAGINNGFTDAPSYAMLPFGPYTSRTGKCVAFRGSVTVPAAGIGNPFATIPGAYQPQAGPFSRVNGLVNNGGGQSGRIDLHSNGNLFLTGSFGAAAIVDITGITFI